MQARLAVPRRPRTGIILLVTVSLLTLFAIVGLSFVLYAESQAQSSRLFREAGVQFRPEAEPELLLNFFLGQLLYGTDDVFSALRGHSLAENMFGNEGPGLNTTPYSGVGRFHRDYVAPPALNGHDNFDLVNYTWFGADDFLRDPERYDLRQRPQEPLSARYIKGSVSYTYPDGNNLFLAAVQASDGRVLIPSFHRDYLSVDPISGRPRGFGSLARTNANWTSRVGKYLTLRPRPADHTQAFPYPEDLGGDVKNLADSPGYLIPNTSPPQFANNDSIWLDLGFPVRTTPEGKKYKPLFAPLIQDLDNRVNVNFHGNALGYRFREDINNVRLFSTSHQGVCPGEVNPQRVLTELMPGNVPELRNLFFGMRLQEAVYDPRPNPNPPHARGRYHYSVWRDPGTHRLINEFAPGGHFFNSTNLDCWQHDRPGLTLPQPGSGQTTPKLEHDFSHGWYQNDGMDKPGHPNLYNGFDPEWCYYVSPPARVNNRSFDISNMEALLRYNDTGSPALTSELFVLCPRSLQNPKTRRLVTTHSFDLARPGVVPSIWNDRRLPTYQLAPGAAFPKRPPLPFPDLANPPPAVGEFGPNWEAVTHRPAVGPKLAGRLDLNRGFEDYPALVDYRFTDLAQYAKAHGDRVRMAEEVFHLLRSVTGAADPADPAVDPASPEYAAFRWLAQLAVNVVDYVSFPRPGQTNEAVSRVDDVMTCFNWNPRFRDNPENGWVVGTIYPRLVVNEAYVEIANVPGQSSQQPATRYDVNFWVELLNPLSSNTGTKPHTHPAIPLAENGTARLQVVAGNYAAYRVLLAQRGTPGDPASDNRLQLRTATNVLGAPRHVQAVVDAFTRDTTAGQPLLFNNANQADELRKVLPVNQADTAYQQCADGSNKGFFVLGPKTAFPGTAAATTFFATLPILDQPCSDPVYVNLRSKMAYEHRSTGQTDFSEMQHSIVLQRLACPYLAPQPDPTRPNYNPYVTVDYLDAVPINDAVTVDGVGPHTPTPLGERRSLGRNQPYAAQHSQQVAQLVPRTGQPQHTFFKMNHQGRPGNEPFRFAYDWLIHLNRPVNSLLELLHVSAFKPSELTQQFMQGGTDPQTGKPLAKFQHRAPWFEADALIWRALEFLEAGFRPQMAPVGGRFPGRINLNTVWDVDTLHALCDARGTNFFTDAGVRTVFTRLLQSRTPSGSPGPRDRPFRGLAAAHTAPEAQYPLGSGLEDTFLRPAPDDTNPVPSQRRRLFQPLRDQAGTELRTTASDHPYLQDELMMKIFGNTTTRSHVFAVWLTVGFFEVVDDSDKTRPPRLGAEIGKTENRQARHRLFAIVDRSRMTLDPADRTKPGPLPFFLESRNGVLSDPLNPQALNVLPIIQTNGFRHDGANGAIVQGTQLVVDVGPNQETVTVAAPPQGKQFQAIFQKLHPSGVALSNVILGHPGPQPAFNMRDPKYEGVVRYFSAVVR